MRIFTRFCALVVYVFFAVRACGQGTTFQFYNYEPAAGINAPVLDTTGARLTGLSFMAELYGGPTKDSLTPAFYGGSRLPVSFLTGAGAGYFNTSVGGYYIPNVPDLGFAWLQVRAWDAKLGNTYEDAAAKRMGGYGSSYFLYLEGGGNGPVPGQTPTPLYGLQSFSLLPEVPEPSSIALFVLDLPVIFSLRWKNPR